MNLLKLVSIICSAHNYKMLVTLNNTILIVAEKTNEDYHSTAFSTMFLLGSHSVPKMKDMVTQAKRQILNSI